MPWYFVLHNEIPRFFALNFNQYPKSVVYSKSVIRPYEDFLDYFLRSFGFYKMPFACF